ncbi:MAG TPA: thioredoxin family protein, partial [Pirellulales bacterium]
MHLIPWAICAVAAIGAGEPVLVDFSASWCGPCRQMEPVVARLEQEGYRVKRVDIDEQRELAAQYRVEAIPCFIMLVDGREVGRLVGSASHAELVALYPPRPAGANASPDRRSLLDRTLPPPPTQAIAAPPVAIPVSNSAPAAPMVAPASFARAAAPAPVAAPVSPAAQPAAAGLRNLRKRAVAPNGTAPNIATAPISASDPIAGCLAASVRLKLDDPTGRSCGSGTVIDALDHEALVLTCGHIFREG